MREWMLGLLGAAALYSVAWVEKMPEPVPSQPPAPADVVSSPAATPHGEAVSPSELAVAPMTPTAPAHPAPQGAPTPVAPSPARGLSVVSGLSAEGGSDPARGAAGDVAREPMPELPPSLRKTFDRLRELQQLGPDPRRLADRVQKLDVDPAELQELREFAERFVDVPPERVRLEELR